MNCYYNKSQPKHSLLAILLTVLIAVGGIISMPGCKAAAGTGQYKKTELEFSDAKALLEAIWKEDPEAERPAVVGGIGSTAIEDKVAALPLEEPEILAPSLAVPESLAQSCRSGACIRQALLANDFTAMIWQLDDGQNLDELARKCQEQLKKNPWLDTVPQVYAIGWQGDFLMICYGQKTWVDPFVKASRNVMKDPALQKGTI